MASAISPACPGSNRYRTTDVIFAVDSIQAASGCPATALHRLYRRNIFAILALARQFTLRCSGLMEIFHLLNYGLAIILAFIGVKMLAQIRLKFPPHTPWFHRSCAGKLRSAEALAIKTAREHNPRSKVRSVTHACWPALNPRALPVRLY